MSEFASLPGTCEPPPRTETVRLMPPASNDGKPYLSPMARASRTQQLELENRRLREMVGDLMLEAEILRAALRRATPDANSAAIR